MAADGEPGGRGLAACVEAFLRHPSAGRRRRPGHDPGAAGPRQPVHDPALHSGRVRPVASPVLEAPPAGVTVSLARTQFTMMRQTNMKRLWSRSGSSGDEKAPEQLVL